MRAISLSIAVCYTSGQDFRYRDSDVQSPLLLVLEGNATGSESRRLIASIFVDLRPSAIHFSWLYRSLVVTRRRFIETTNIYVLHFSMDYDSGTELYFTQTT